MNNLEFKEDTHQYFYNGMEVPSVTQIISASNSGALQNIPSNILDSASERGIAVHQAIEFFNKYKFANISKEYEDYFEAYRKWYRKEGFSFIEIQSEIKVYHKILNYAGTIDMLITNTKEEKMLIDIKTTNELNMKYVSLQLSAYKDALSNQGISVKKMYVLWLKKDGTYEYLEVPDKKNIFMYSLLLYNFWKENKNES
jgi:hypothetical protein